MGQDNQGSGSQDDSGASPLDEWVSGERSTTSLVGRLLSVFGIK